MKPENVSYVSLHLRKLSPLDNQHRYINAEILDFSTVQILKFSKFFCQYDFLVFEET
jgi:hypothetical protein